MISTKLNLLLGQNHSLKNAKLKVSRSFNKFHFPPWLLKMSWVLSLALSFSLGLALGNFYGRDSKRP